MKKKIFIPLISALFIVLSLLTSCNGIGSKNGQINKTIKNMWKEAKGSDVPAPVLKASAEVSGVGYDTLALCADDGDPVLILVNSAERSASVLPTKLYVQCVFEGLYQDGIDPERLVQTIADCYTEYGEDAFLNVSGVGYGTLLDGICQLGTLKQCRQYVLSAMVNGTEDDVLFVKGSPRLACVVTTTEGQKYNWSSVPENLAKYYYNTDRSTYYALELNLGPAYSSVKKYAAYPVLIDRDTEELTVSEKEKVFSSMSEMKKALNAEELG